MHHLMNAAAIDRLNARSREARRLDGIEAEFAWNDPDQIDMRRQHAAMRVRRDLTSAVASAAFSVQSATTARTQASARLSNAEANRYSAASTIMQAELDVRRFTRNLLDAEITHTAAVAALADAGFAPVSVTL